jgi:hypothetical protein
MMKLLLVVVLMASKAVGATGPGEINKDKAVHVSKVDSSTKGPKKSAKPKTRTLKDVIDSAMGEGRETFLNPDTAKNLGVAESQLARGRITSKAIRYQAEVAPDKKQHIFEVVYRTEEGRRVPEFLTWHSYKFEKRESGKFMDGYTFRVLLDGTLAGAVAIRGKVRETQHEGVSINAKEIADLFRQEQNFYLKDSLAIPMSNK